MVVLNNDNFNINDDYYYWVNKRARSFDSYENVSDESKFTFRKSQIFKQIEPEYTPRKVHGSLKSNEESQTITNTTDICIIAGSDLDNKLAENQEELLNKLWLYSKPPTNLSSVQTRITTETMENSRQIFSNHLDLKHKSKKQVNKSYGEITAYVNDAMKLKSSNSY